MSCVKEQDVPRDLLPSASELDKTDALGTLKAFGFIKERLRSTSYDMHQLVRRAVQYAIFTGRSTRSKRTRPLLQPRHAGARLPNHVEAVAKLRRGLRVDSLHKLLEDNKRGHATDLAGIECE